MRERLEVTVSGRVQGVWFRAATRDQARRLGLSGWVRNLPGGEVQAVFEGERDALESVLSWCRTGPPLAAVARVEAAWGAAAGEFEGFSVRP